MTTIRFRKSCFAHTATEAALSLGERRNSPVETNGGTLPDTFTVPADRELSSVALGTKGDLGS